MCENNKGFIACRRNRTKEVEKVLKFLEKCSGRNIIMGIHNREPNAIPDLQTKEAIRVTGKQPALWSGDFLFLEEDIENRWKMIYECKKQWEEGSIVQLMFHVSPPNLGEPGVWEHGVKSYLSDEEWNSLIKYGGRLNTVWKKRLDDYAEYLQYLKENHVPVLFRPFHEMNQSLFWWGGRTGKNGTGALYRLTREYLEMEKGLDNIIWVWNIQDLDYTWEKYNPGNEYWDIFSLDVYNEDRFTMRKYEEMLRIAGNKLIAIGECDVLPDVKVLEEQPRWVFCMSWAELTFQMNTKEKIKELYNAENVLCKDKMLI